MGNIVDFQNYKFKKGLSKQCSSFQNNQRVSKELKQSKEVPLIDDFEVCCIMAVYEGSVREALRKTKDSVPPMGEDRLYPMRWTGENWRWYLKTHMENK